MERNALIDRLNALTDALEHAVAMADWDEAARLADERSPLVMSLGADQSANGLAIVRRIRESNDAIFAGARAAQRELSDEFSEATGRVQAAGQYQNIARL